MEISLMKLMPSPGITAAENLLQETKGYAGLKVAVESTHSVASRVVNMILDNWSVYELTIPGK